MPQWTGIKKAAPISDAFVPSHCCPFSHGLTSGRSKEEYRFNRCQSEKCSIRFFSYTKNASNSRASPSNVQPVDSTCEFTRYATPRPSSFFIIFPSGGVAGDRSIAIPRGL